jgi:DNA-binding NarL/FixJ family response regulator
MILRYAMCFAGGYMKSHSCRVLLVDDHDQIRDALRLLLLSYGDIEVIGEARDGEEAIIRTASCQPEIIVMDINMPRMNGIQATTIIKKSRKQTAIIGLCVIQDTYTIEAFLKAGGLAVVSKQRLEDLRPTIQRACVNRSTAPSGKR